VFWVCTKPPLGSCSTLAKLAVGIELDQAAAMLILEQERRDVAGLRAAVGGVAEAVHLEPRTETPGAADGESGVGTDGIDFAYFGVAVGERHDLNVAAAPQVGGEQLCLVGELRPGRGRCRHAPGGRRSMRRTSSTSAGSLACGCAFS